MRALVLVVVALAGLGCEEITRRITFERMVEQPRIDAFEPAPSPAEAPARRPVAGTIPRERALERVDLALDRIPIEVDAALLRRGRMYFERLCAACHGVLGTGNPGVVSHMELRPPPSLFEARIRRQPPGTLYATITNGFGLMPAYARWLAPRDRWAVIAHLQVLWTSQLARLDDLPPHWAARAREELP